MNITICRLPILHYFLWSVIPQTCGKILFKTEHVFLIHLYIMGYRTVETKLDGFQRPFSYCCTVKEHYSQDGPETGLSTEKSSLQ